VYRCVDDFGRLGRLPEADAGPRPAATGSAAGCDTTTASSTAAAATTTAGPGSEAVDGG
jgi:hypothetical protein